MQLRVDYFPFAFQFQILFPHTYEMSIRGPITGFPGKRLAKDVRLEYCTTLQLVGATMHESESYSI